MGRSARLPAPRRQPVVFRWDLDKTYLKSDFHTLRGLVTIPFEKPEEKVAVPGVVPLIRNLRRVAHEQRRQVWIYFISASPPQIARAIKEKLALDGIEYDGITFKNQLQNIMRGRFRNLREQVGYKLTELLRQRGQCPVEACEVLFGDDWESDPIIYSLYADLLAGRVKSEELPHILAPIGVDPELIQEATQLARELPKADAVERIYINLERRTPPASFLPFGARLIPTFNYFQTACCLYQDGYLDAPAVIDVARGLVEEAAYTPRQLFNSLADIERRGHLHTAIRAEIERELVLAKIFAPRRRSALERLRDWMRWHTRRAEPRLMTRLPKAPQSPAIDYRELVVAWSRRHEQAEEPV